METVLFIISTNYKMSKHTQGCPRGVMVKAMDC